MKLQNAVKFRDRLRKGAGTVRTRDNLFGFGSLEMGTPVNDNTIGTV